MSDDPNGYKAEMARLRGSLGPASYVGNLSAYQPPVMYDIDKDAHRAVTQGDVDRWIAIERTLVRWMKQSEEMVFHAKLEHKR